MDHNTMSFEESLQRLEQIVRIMERGEAPLDDALKLFQEGTQLVGSCSKMLDEAQLQVQTILSGPDGEPREEAFVGEQ